MILIGLGGYATSGKDAVADFLVKNHGFYKTYMSKPLEQALLTLDPWVLLPPTVDFTKDGFERYSLVHRVLGYDKSKEIPNVRQYLQRLGTEIGRSMFGENSWVDIMTKDVLESGSDRVVVTGIRYQNEMNAIKHLGGSTVWVERGLTPVNSHSSDNALGKDDFDLTITNDSTLGNLEARTTDLFRMVS